MINDLLEMAQDARARQQAALDELITAALESEAAHRALSDALIARLDADINDGMYRAHISEAVREMFCSAWTAGRCREMQDANNISHSTGDVRR